MADKTSDVEDRLLESVFRAEPIADDGFCNRIVARIRRRIWLSRLAVPVAAVIGGAIAIKPAAALVKMLVQILGVAPAQIINVPLKFMPQIQLVVLGGMLFAVALVLLRFLDET
jgi:hypothetical protein